MPPVKPTAVPTAVPLVKPTAVPPAVPPAAPPVMKVGKPVRDSTSSWQRNQVGEPPPSLFSSIRPTPLSPPPSLGRGGSDTYASTTERTNERRHHRHRRSTTHGTTYNSSRARTTQLESPSPPSERRLSTSTSQPTNSTPRPTTRRPRHPVRRPVRMRLYAPPRASPPTLLRFA